MKAHARMHEELERQSQLNFLTMPSLTFFSNSRLVIYDYLPTTAAMRVPATVAPLVQQWAPVRCNPIHTRTIMHMRDIESSDGQCQRALNIYLAGCHSLG